MQSHKTVGLPLSDVSLTMLRTLAAKGYASERAPDVGFDDPDARQLIDTLAMDLTAYGEDTQFVRFLALRAQLIDQLAVNFLRQHPGTLGIGLGCGLCTRGQRLRRYLGNDIQFDWYDVDLPSVIEMRYRYLSSIPRAYALARSVTDTSWLSATGWQLGRPLLLVMEGVAQYLSATQNQTFFATLGELLGPSEAPTDMLMDYLHSAMVIGHQWFKSVGDVKTPFQSGFNHAQAIQELHPSIEVVDEHHFVSKVSPAHALFELEFQVANHGERPYGIAHLRFGTTSTSSQHRD